jgi:hypothetical protein
VPPRRRLDLREHDMPTDPQPKSGKKPDDQWLSDALSGFNAEQIIDDPDNLDPDDEKDEGLAATPDSPNPI